MSSLSVSFPRASAGEVPYNQLHSTSFKELLNGDKAFYLQGDYVKDSLLEFAQSKPLPVTYAVDVENHTKNKINRIAKQIFSIIIFPIGIYQLLHASAGKILLPISSSTILRILRYPQNFANTTRSKIGLESEWKYKRITVEVAGYTIDGMIVGKKSTFSNRRWVLVSNGNGVFYEDFLASSDSWKDVLNEVNGNAIVFNYPGVGASSGLPSRQAMVKAYRAMLTLLEDQENGIGAREIIGYGFSIGGAVQGEALKTHELKEGVKYVFVKDRTFGDLSTTASILTNKLLGSLVKILGWNMGSVESSKKLKAPEIILQTASVPSCEELADSSKIIGDGTIAAKASLAKALLEDATCQRGNKAFIGIPEVHSEALSDCQLLGNKIKSFLESQYTETT